jgi:hypothetical protein
VNQREVATLDVSPTNRLLKGSVRLSGSRDDEEARRVAVEPMDDSGAVRIGSATRSKRQELSRECLRSSSRARVYGDSCRFVDDKEMLVVEEHRNGRRLGLQRVLRTRELHLHHRSILEPVTLRATHTVHEDGALLQQALGE